jgi:hypothetical protein
MNDAAVENEPKAFIAKTRNVHRLALEELMKRGLAIRSVPRLCDALRRHVGAPHRRIGKVAPRRPAASSKLAR